MQQVYCLQLRRSRNLIGSGAGLSLAYNAKNRTTSVTPPGDSSVRYSVVEGQHMSGNRVGREIAGLVLGVALIVLLGMLLRDVLEINDMVASILGAAIGGGLATYIWLRVLVPEKLARDGGNRSARRDIIRALVVLAVLAALWVVTSILLGRRCVRA